MPIPPDTNRYAGIARDYSSEDIRRLQGTVQVEHTLARLGAQRLWQLLHNKPFLRVLGAMTGNQAVQQVKAGLEAIYLSGWQVAADANNAGQLTRISRSTRAPPCLRLSGASTTLCSEPIR
jgi:isocitrate lyase